MIEAAAALAIALAVGGPGAMLMTLLLIWLATVLLPGRRIRFNLHRL